MEDEEISNFLKKMRPGTKNYPHIAERCSGNPFESLSQLKFKFRETIHSEIPYSMDNASHIEIYWSLQIRTFYCDY